MNIAAVMSILRLELPAPEKHLLLVLAARAPRGGWEVTRSVAALAADMGAGARSVERATHDLRRRGPAYLQVVHRVGETSTYRLGTAVNMAGVTPANMADPPPPDRPYPAANMAPSRRKTGEKQEVTPPDSTQAPSGVTVDNDARRVSPSPPRVGGRSSSNGTEPTPRAYLPPSSGSTWQAGARPHPPECECEGTGWLEVVDDKGRLAVGRCER